MLGASVVRCGAVVTFVGTASLAAGDGFPIKDGRYDGQVTVLKLTAGQVAALRESRQLKLTEDQKRLLKSEAGVAPSQLLVYFTKDGENDCSCMAHNVGFRFTDEQLEVPHTHVVSDEEATRLEAGQDER